MDPRKFPNLPRHLIPTLKELLPANSPKPGETMDQIMFRAGQWEIVRLLEQVEEYQTSHHRILQGA
jgi:hypothetical protein